MRALIVVLFSIVSLLLSIDSKASEHNKENKQDEKIEKLLAAANIYDLRNDLKTRDSLFDIAIELAGLSSEDSVVVNIYNHYFENPEEYFTDNAISYAKSLTELSNKHNNTVWHSYSYIAATKVDLYNGNNKAALENAGQAFYYASITKNTVLKVRTMLLLGNCLELNNKKVEAFKKYTDALYLSRESEDNGLIYNCYQYLASFYSLIDNMEKAKEYKNEQFKILLAHQPIDSVKFIKLSINLAGFLFDNNERVPAEKLINRSLNFTIRHDYIRLKQLTFITYRTYLINNSLFNELSELYTDKYPQELIRVSATNRSLYYRLKAFITEAKGQPDSSEYYYALAETKLNNNDGVFLSNFYKRYGEFLLRRGKLDAAKVKLEKAYESAASAQYLPYLTELTHELDSLNYQKGNTGEAYKYAKLNLQYSKQAELVHQEEELLKLEVENEARERELMAHREAEATERQHNIQYMGLSIAIVLSFILLAMIASFKIPSFVLKAIGFFSFIFFFEFIIMLADHKIHHITHGEPWKFMAFKIVLIGILLPLHHWLEHKVVHYLSNHKLIDTSKISWKGLMAKFSKPKAEVVKEAVKQQVPTEKH